MSAIRYRWVATRSSRLGARRCSWAGWMRAVVPAVLLVATLAGCGSTPATAPSAVAPVTAHPATTVAPRSALTTTPSSSTTTPSSSTTTTTTTTTVPVPVTTVPAPTTPAPAAPDTLVTEPDQGMGAIDTLLSSATRTLDMTMYELADPEAESLLEADAHRGVAVRVILDQDYSGAAVNGPAFSQLSAAGVEVHWAPADVIFHQKTITVDDREAAVMTLNLTSAYYPSTRDFAVLTTDTADVSAIEQVFETDWSAGQAAPGPGPAGADLVWSPGAEPALAALIDGARRTLQVENEEMEDTDITDALVAAAGRGVQVEVTMTASPSWVGAFGALTAAGVHVHVDAESAPLYIHAKVVVADGATAYVGSQNFSYSSLDDNRELGVVTSEPAIVSGLSVTLTRDFDGAPPYGG